MAQFATRIRSFPWFQQTLQQTQCLLPMTCSDIREYLGLTVETVSRIFTGLQRKGLIKVNNREVELLEIETLREIIGNS